MNLFNTTEHDGENTLFNNPAKPVEYLEDEYLYSTDILDLDKFFKEMQESKPTTTNLLEKNDTQVALVSNSSDKVELMQSSLNDLTKNVDDFIYISSDEESVLKDMGSLEDEIPLSVLIKNNNDTYLNDVRMKFEHHNSNSTKLVDIVPCAEVKRKTLDDFLISDIDYKMIDPSLEYNETNNDDNGYHSSDFEFITENEAKVAGIIKNKNKGNIRRYVAHESRYYDRFKNAIKNDNLCSNDYRRNHVVPTGDNYINLFKGHAPMNSGFMENKAFHVSKMSIDFEGIGFNTKMHYREVEDNVEYREEAEKVALMISRLYPNENRKKRRRYQKDKI